MHDRFMQRRAYLLAGGQSQRFGADKARAELDGQPILKRFATQLEKRSWHVTVVAQSTTDYTDLGLRCIADFVPNSGPLAGLVTALKDCQQQAENWCLIATCDLVAWELGWLDPMEHRIDVEGVSVVRLPSNEFLPFPALYSTSILPMAREIWKTGGRSLRELHRRLGEGVIEVACDPKLFPRSFNTPEEFSQLIAMSTSYRLGP
jgi:molybdopterin-guanine dinucleotide biosynthesis protein A